MNHKKIILFLGASWLCGAMAWAQMPDLLPMPQQCIVGEGRYPAPASFLYKGLNETDSINRKFAQSLLQGTDKAKDYWKLVIGERGDRAVRKVRKRIPDVSEGYYLRIRENEIIIAGNDERGTLYGLQTLRQLLRSEELPELEITDFPDVPLRGVVEGYYGTPMNQETHLRMLQFYGAHKMNIYLYGPKDDPYHSSPYWRKPYPEEKAQEIREMVQTSREAGVDFVWAIHPGKDIRWNEADRDSVRLKLEAMYDLGVRSFAVFFDDISGEGARAEKQVELLNYLNREFIHTKVDVKPLIMCPTEYNKEWSDPEGGYLETLGEKLDADIAIMWTGNSVICTLQPADLQWVNERIRRKAFVWWNFPVNDYVMDHLLLGPVYGNSLQLAGQVSGFVSNPMEHAEASKIALYGIADYTWNMTPYDSIRAWNYAFQELMPKDKDALRLFAEHNADPGLNVHHFERDESVRVRPIFDRFLRLALENTVTSSADYRCIRSEFQAISDAADILQANDENPYLKKEISPWYPAFKYLGEMGCEVMNLYDAWRAQNQEDFKKSHRHLRALQYLSYQYDAKTNQEVNQPGVKVGGKVLRPFVDKLFIHLTEEFNYRFKDSLATTLNYSPYRLESDVAQLRNLSVSLRKGNQITVSPLNEVLHWNAGGSLTLMLQEPMQAAYVRFDVGVDSPDWLVFECQAEDGSWKTLEPRLVWSTIYQIDLPKEGKIRAIRATNHASEQSCYFKSFLLKLGD